MRKTATFVALEKVFCGFREFTTGGGKYFPSR
jgi:hypothetical protein